MNVPKPAPVPDRETAPFWEGTAAGELRVQRCDDCGHAQLYPRVVCTSCHGESLAWEVSSGRGRVYSFTVIRRAPTPAFEPDVPYVVALVELDEGPRLMSNVRGVPVEEVRIGMPVEVAFEARGEPAVHLPQFVATGGG